MNRKGVLLVNLGSPDSPAVRDVRRYLREFLMDKRVLDMAYPLRFALVHGCILPFRPKQSAEAYHKIWTSEGSPLIVSSRRVQELLRTRVDVPVELAMRYQNPSIKQALAALIQQGVTELLLIPLFPHYATSSFETAVVRVRQLLKRMAPRMKLNTVPPYYGHPDYIEALAARAEPFLAQDYDHLLFSFHGVPERHLRKADPTRSHCLLTKNCCEVTSSAHATCYRAQCFRTVRALADRLTIPQVKYSIAFQSRLGRDPWLQPYTDQALARLAANGVRKLLVICPAFVTDCLETLEEIGLRGREIFLAAGGAEFQMIPCLNDHPAWVAFLERLIRDFAGVLEEGGVWTQHAGGTKLSTAA